jgi:putative two-component system response regulator
MPDPHPGFLNGAGPKVVIAEDDLPSRVLLRAILEREGCVVRESADGASALRLVADDPPDLLLLDVNMPPPDGMEVTRLVRQRHGDAELPIMLITGHGETPIKVAGLEAGATDFITKPYEPTELVARIRAAMRTRAAMLRLESAQGVIATLANAVEAKDPTTEQHCSRLADLALILARRAGKSGDTLEAISYGAVLHDVGKIGVREAVILKTGPLTEDEFVEMRRHPGVGADIVAPLQLGKLVSPIVRGHHEHWNGKGYPDGLRGTNIPFGARVVAVVDAYDAMVHDRPYRRALSEDQARSQLITHSGSQFDPELAELWLEYLASRDTPSAVSVMAPADRVAAFTRGLTEEPVRR